MQFPGTDKKLVETVSPNPQNMCAHLPCSRHVGYIVWPENYQKFPGSTCSPRTPSPDSKLPTPRAPVDPSLGLPSYTPLSCEVAMGQLFASSLERAWMCGLLARTGLVFLAQNSKETKNSKLFETAFQAVKVEG